MVDLLPDGIEGNTCRRIHTTPLLPRVNTGEPRRKSAVRNAAATFTNPMPGEPT
jgi:hypothetical protein